MQILKSPDEGVHAAEEDSRNGRGRSSQDNNLKLVTGELPGHIRGNCWLQFSQKRIMPPERNALFALYFFVLIVLKFGFYIN